MSSDLDQSLLAAYARVRQELLSEAATVGHWTGELASSALSTATAISALSLVGRHGATDGPQAWVTLEIRRKIHDLILAGIDWLAARQNADGGWGDTDRSLSNIATTMLVRAAIHLTVLPAKHGDLLERANEYCKRRGEFDGVRRRYGRDKTFAVPILTNCALAGMVPWREVSSLPFELACVPQHWFRFLRLPVVSYAIPALVAIGQCRFFHRPPLNPLLRWIRRRSQAKSLRVLAQMQPPSGGFLEATPLTSFVVMSLASMDLVEHPVVKAGAQFLFDSVRPDGSWPIDTNLATWNTTLALNALAQQPDEPPPFLPECLQWVLRCQHRQQHPFTGAEPGGWGWTDLSGAVPDADDTPSAMLALAKYASQIADQRALDAALSQGIEWLLGLQNSDGGWPTFCRGWGTLPFDRSSPDLTAHVIRAFYACLQRKLGDEQRVTTALERGFNYLSKVQRADGSWVPLWFGNQHHEHEENPIYGSARVLLAYRETGRMHLPSAQRCWSWLASQQNTDGGWGGGPNLERGKANGPVQSSIEETALTLEALLPAGADATMQARIDKGLSWLIEQIQAGHHRDAAPIGFYFAKLWYYERLYPVIFSASALGRAVAVRSLAARPVTQPA